MVEALTTVLDKGRTPEKLRTDRGVEYKNRVVQTLMKERDIDHFFTQNESKANFAERAIKNIKLRISRYRSRHQTNRWIDVLSDITESYNQTYHRSIKRAPSQVKKKDEALLWKIQYKDKVRGGPATRYQFKVGDKVPHFPFTTTFSTRIRRALDLRVFRNRFPWNEPRYSLL